MTDIVNTLLLPENIGKMDPLVSTSTKLSIVLGTCNRLAGLTQCLDSIRGKLPFPCQIVVVDAGSTDGSIEYVRNLDDVILIEDGEKLGQAKSLNRIFRRLQGDYVCWISDDNIVVAEKLASAVRIMDTNADIGMLSLKVKDIAGLHAKEHYIGGIWYPTRVLNVNQGLVRLSVMREVDYFDEEFRDYGIDADLATKVLLTGCKVAYTKDVVIFHNRDYEQSPGAIENSERHARLLRAKELYLRKYESIFAQHYRRPEQRLGLLITTLYGVVQILKRVALRPSPGMFSYNERDWHNVAFSAYIDKFDLWKTRHEDYYLVQQIARAAR